MSSSCRPQEPAGLLQPVPRLLRPPEPGHWPGRGRGRQLGLRRLGRLRHGGLQTPLCGCVCNSPTKPFRTKICIDGCTSQSTFAGLCLIYKAKGVTMPRPPRRRYCVGKCHHRRQFNLPEPSIQVRMKHGGGLYH